MNRTQPEAGSIQAFQERRLREKGLGPCGTMTVRFALGAGPSEPSFDPSELEDRVKQTPPDCFYSFRQSSEGAPSHGTQFTAEVWLPVDVDVE